MYKRQLQDSLGDYAGSAESGRHAVAIMDRLGHLIEGEDGPAIHVRALLQLACAYRALGRYPEAEQEALRAIPVAQNAFGPEATQTCAAYNNLAVIYKFMGRFDEAEKLYHRALASAVRVYGEDHWEASGIYHNLGGLEHARGRFDRAEPFARAMRFG